MKIYKYVLDDYVIEGSITSFRVPLPGTWPIRQPKILHFGIQHDKFCIWALVDPDGKTIFDWHLRIAGTGNNAPDMPHLGTAFTDPQGTYVFHLFGRGKERPE